MPDLKDFLQNNEASMREQLAKKPFPNQKQIDRNNETRPWSSQTEDLDFDDQIKVQASSKVLQRNHSFNALDTILEYRISLLALMIFSAAVFFPIAIFYPVNYFSVQQAYIPERTDTITSRIGLLTNRIEFASMPVESKLPTSLVVRRLNTTEARDWVIKQAYSQLQYENLRSSLKPESVSVEVTYDASLETLTLIGYANSPEWAAIITQLYWEYLLKIAKEADEKIQQKINQWMFALNERIDADIASLTDQIESNSKGSKTGVQLNYVQNTLSESYANQELNRTHLMQLHRDLQLAKNTPNLDLLKDSSDPDIAALIQMRKQLIASPESSYYFKRIDEIEQQIPIMIRQKLSQVEYQLKKIDQANISVKGQLARNQNLETKEIISNEKNEFVRSQLVALKEQKADLTKLQSQLNIETSLNKNKDFRVLTSATANESSLRPTRSVRLALALFASLLIPFSLIFSFVFLNRKYN